MVVGAVGLQVATYISPWFPGWNRDEIAQVAVLEGTWQSRVFGMLRQWAVAWNGQIHLTRPGLDKIKDGTVPEEALLAHELVHVSQQWDMGWRPWLVMYLWASFWGLIKRIPVDRHPLESEAYRVGDAVWESIGS